MPIRLAATALLAALCLNAQAQAQHAHPATAARPGDQGACETTIEGQPGKRFSLAEIRVSARCENFTVHLVHTGRKPWQEAGHNWVLARSADIDAVIADGLRAGPDRAWVERGDARVIAATQMLSGGEHASVSFPVARLRRGERYTYFCSYPSHALPMRGQLVLVD
jgi:azurin